MPVLQRGTGAAFGLAGENSLNDAQRRRLRYHLLRLTAVGLRPLDVEELAELGRSAFLAGPTTAVADRIRQRPDASAVAVAIADIVAEASGAARQRDAFLGAVLGAYAGLHGLSRNDKETAAVVGAIGGGITATTCTVIRQILLDTSLEDYLHPDG
jgi:hypothetical protein